MKIPRDKFRVFDLATVARVHRPGICVCDVDGHDQPGERIHAINLKAVVTKDGAPG